MEWNGSVTLFPGREPLTLACTPRMQQSNDSNGTEIDAYLFGSYHL